MLVVHIIIIILYKLFFTYEQIDYFSFEFNLYGDESTWDVIVVRESSIIVKLQTLNYYKTIVKKLKFLTRRRKKQITSNTLSMPIGFFFQKI